MKKVRRKHLGRRVAGRLVAALAFVAAGCGGDDGGESASGEDWQIAGLGSTLEEIQSMARDEGEVNLVIWPAYATSPGPTSSRTQTGCEVNTKDGATATTWSTLMPAGAYDGVSASGDASCG